MKRWFDFRAQARGAEIVIYDEIGAFGIPAKAFLDELKALGPVGELTVRINSPGGSVFDGVAIYNALKRHDGAVTVWIDGIAGNVAGPCAEVEALMGPGVDPHLYQASASDVRRFQDADLIFYSGYALEGQLGEVLKQVGNKKPTLAVSPSWITAAMALPKAKLV